MQQLCSRAVQKCNGGIEGKRFPQGSKARDVIDNTVNTSRRVWGGRDGFQEEWIILGGERFGAGDDGMEELVEFCGPGIVHGEGRGGGL